METVHIFNEYIDIARQLHGCYKLFSEKSSRKSVYRCRLLEEFILSAYFQSVFKQRTGFSYFFKQTLSYVYKNYVILMDMVIERAASVYNTHKDYQKLKSLISKRKNYFEVSSVFDLENRMNLIQENFRLVQKLVGSKYFLS